MSAARLVEVTACQVCGSEQHRKLFQEPPYTVLRCTDCGLVFVTPRLDQEALADVYGHTYWQSDSPKTQGYSNYTADEHLYLKTFRRRMKMLPLKHGQAVKVLDVGCAAGFFLRVMKENGHQVYGVELSETIAAHARQHLGDDAIHVGTLDDLAEDRAGFEKASFDLITMWDVIEHVTDPQNLLRQARELLKPDGRLILETQNVDSLFALLLGRRWHHYKHQEHLYHFNRETVRTVLTQAGFEVLRNTSSYGGKYVSLSFIAERTGRLHKSISFLLRPLGLLKNANVYLNLGDEMVITARLTAAAPSSSDNNAPAEASDRDMVCRTASQAASD